MSIISKFKHGIFFRIYAGLLLVCLAVAIFSKLLITTVNEHRAQKYREDISNGVFYIISEGISHQTTDKQREYWLSDASNLFGETFSIHEIASIKFNRYEQNRLNHHLSVVRFDKYQIARVFYPLKDTKNVLSVKMARVDEQQVRALAIFLLDDLAYHSTFEERKQHLTELSKIFPFPVQYKNMSEINVDTDQLNRLRRNEVVIVFNDNSTSTADTTSIRVWIPSEVNDMLIEMGPMPLFKWFPLNLLIAIALLSMLLISLGVYTLILPLQKKLNFLQLGLNDISEGKLDTRLIVKGQDETAKLSATFNAMAEHIKRLIESQRELTRAVSHELRTPVARIRFAIDMLADTDEYESRCSQRDYIDADIEELNELIDEMLTYAKLEEGSPRLDWEMVDLQELIEQITKESNALGKSIQVTYDASDKIFAEADRRYLHRVVQNLAGNALRYANKNIIVSAGIKKDMAFVSVEDDGHGIAEKDRDKVFVPFARLDDSRTRASGGYGLGLSIVSRICFWFNGSMSVDDSHLGGARFTMTWPVKQITQTISADNMTQQTSERKIIKS